MLKLLWIGMSPSGDGLRERARQPAVGAARWPSAVDRGFGAGERARGEEVPVDGLERLDVSSSCGRSDDVDVEADMGSDMSRCCCEGIRACLFVIMVVQWFVERCRSKSVVVS